MYKTDLGQFQFTCLRTIVIFGNDSLGAESEERNGRGGGGAEAAAARGVETAGAERMTMSPPQESRCQRNSGG